MTLRVSQKPGVSLAPTYTEPTQPTGLVVLGTTATTATLRANPSTVTDNTYLLGYRWYVNGVAYDDTDTPNLTLTGLTENTDYVVTVSALSSKRVESEQSDDVTATTTESTNDEAEPPTVPTEPTDATTSSVPAVFYWGPSTSVDEYQLLGYRVYRDGVYQGATSALYWIDDTVAPGGTYTYQVSAYTSGAESARASVTLTTPQVQQLAFLPVTVPTGYRAGDTIPAWSIGTTGGLGEVTFSIVSGSLYPSGTLLTDGVVPQATTPRTVATEGTYSFTVQAVDEGIGDPITIDLSAILDYPLLRFFPAPQGSPSAVVGEVYGGSALMVANGGDGTYALSLKANTYCPPGLAESEVVADVWQVVGTCTGGSGQTYNPTFVLESGDQTVETTLPISVQSIVANDPLLLDYPPIGPLTEGDAFSPVAAIVSGDIGTLTYSKSGAWPGNMDVNTSTGAIYCPSGNITGAIPGRNYAPLVTVSDDGTTPARTANVRLGIPIEPDVAPTIAITPGTFPAGLEVGDALSVAFTATGFAGTCQWTVTGTNASGVTTPTSGTGSNTLTFTATDIGTAAAGLPFGGTVTATDSADANNTASVPYGYSILPLSTAFVAPSEITPPAMIEFDADTDEVSTITVTSHVDLGSLTASEVTLDLRAVGALQPGVSLSAAGDGNDNQTVTYDADAGSNTQADATVELWATYDDPTSGGGGTLQNTLAERLAWWNALNAQSGSLGGEDFSGFTSDSELWAASYPFGRNSDGVSGGNLPTPGETEIRLNTADAIFGGNCLEVVVLPPAGRGAAGWKMPYNFATYDYRPFYVLHLVKLNKAAMGWISHTAGASSPQAGNKIIYLSRNKQGQVFHACGEGGGPWLQTNKHVTSQLMTSFDIAGTTRYFTHGAIDNGTPTATDLESIMARYGIENRNKFYGVSEGNEWSDTATVPYVTDRAGWPFGPAVSAGSFHMTPDEWAVVVDYVDPAPRNIYPLNGTGPGGRKPRVVTWASTFWSPPVLLCDTFHPNDNGGGYQAAMTTEDGDFESFGLHHYYTDGGAGNNPTRPPMRYFCQAQWHGYSPPVWPGHPTATLTSPYGTIQHYSGI